MSKIYTHRCYVLRIEEYGATEIVGGFSDRVDAIDAGLKLAAVNPRGTYAVCETIGAAVAREPEWVWAHSGNVVEEADDAPAEPDHRDRDSMGDDQC